MNQHRPGIDHLKTLPLGVALRAAAGLSTDRGQIAAGGRRMGQPRLKQESLYPPTAVAGKRAVPAYQRQAIMDHQRAATGGLTVDARQPRRGSGHHAHGDCSLSQRRRKALWFFEETTQHDIDPVLQLIRTHPDDLHIAR